MTNLQVEAECMFSSIEDMKADIVEQMAKLQAKYVFELRRSIRKSWQATLPLRESLLRERLWSIKQMKKVMPGQNSTSTKLPSGETSCARSTLACEAFVTFKA